MSQERIEQVAELYIKAKECIAKDTLNPATLKGIMEVFSPDNENIKFRETYEGNDNELPFAGFELEYTFPKDANIKAIQALTFLLPDKLKSIPSSTAFSSGKDDFSIIFSAKKELPNNAKGKQLEQFLTYDMFRAVSLNAVRIGLYQGVENNNQELIKLPGTYFDKLDNEKLLVATERTKVPFDADINELIKSNLTVSDMDRLAKFDQRSGMLAKELSVAIAPKQDTSPKLEEPEQKRQSPSFR
jgi:hypothetical protein